MEPIGMSLRDIVVALQRGIPLEPRPFAALGRDLGISEEAVLDVARRLLADGIARRFGAVFDARRLGYRSELCALEVPADRIAAAGAAAAAHPGVTHGYLRGVPPDQPPFADVPGLALLPNVWFTLAVPYAGFEDEVARLQESVSPASLLRFPALRRFKIDVVFDPDQRDAGESVPGAPTDPSCADDDGAVEAFSPEERALVRLLQGHLPVGGDVFERAAADASWPADALLDRLRAWRRSGTLRRIALVMRHQRMGFVANAMCVWRVDGVRAIEAGRRLAASPAVTHCYERVTREGWPFNLYAMIHRADWTTARELFERLGSDIGRPPGLMLGSLREFKKTSMRYFENDPTAAEPARP
jgi:DNA-binding Lrp family transcriptional regulator